MNRAVNLKSEYISVDYAGIRSYGGSQTRCVGKTEQRCGCGLVAVCDCLLYMTGGHISLPGYEFHCGKSIISCEKYNNLITALTRYFLMTYPTGINGISLVLGMNLLMKRLHLPYRASWGVPYRDIFERTEKMLEADIPVILAVGPAVNRLADTKKLTFYRRNSDGSHSPAFITSAHYVTVTGIDENWLTISSWGKKLYVNREEYLSYIRKTGTILFTNIVKIS